jgi:hypothetical protein
MREAINANSTDGDKMDFNSQIILER